MTTTQVINSGEGQLVRVPEEIRLASSEVTIRREGNTLVLEPVVVRSADWPVGLFDEVRIDDPAFERPPQGAVIRANLESRGEMIGPYDVLIAAQAVARNPSVVTRNVREFSRVEKLKIVDWTK